MIENTPLSAQPALAREIAVEAHQGQTDKSGKPYFGHVERVASNFDPDTDPVRYSAALLHDSIEDSEGRITKEVLLARGILPRVVEVVDLLTRKDEEENPDDYYLRIKQGPDALAGKLADIKDNTNPERSAQLPIETQRRLLTKYIHACELLGADDYADELRQRLENL